MIIIVILVIFGLSWAVTGRLFAPRLLGAGQCDRCAKPDQLRAFGGSALCRDCFERSDGMIP